MTYKYGIGCCKTKPRNFKGKYRTKTYNNGHTNSNDKGNRNRHS